METQIIKATAGKVLMHIKTGMIMGETVSLGIDYTTEPPMPDVHQNYIEVDSIDTANSSTEQ
jgi:hypothetical protein